MKTDCQSDTRHSAREEDRLIPSWASREMIVPVRAGLVLGSPTSSTNPLKHSLGNTWPDTSHLPHFTPDKSYATKTDNKTVLQQEKNIWAVKPRFKKHYITLDQLLQD